MKLSLASLVIQKRVKRVRSPTVREGTHAIVALLTRGFLTRSKLKTLAREC
jgi:hypothetical protein